jgi:hypothetical protein
MLADESFTVSSGDIYADVDEEFHIIPFGDVHLGSESCAPADLGCAKISITIRRDCSYKKDITSFDLHASV